MRKIFFLTYYLLRIILHVTVSTVANSLINRNVKDDRRFVYVAQW